MQELFKTTLFLSLLGSLLIMLLLLIKPVTAKKFPAKWQYFAWIAVAFSMLIPAYKLIPKNEAKKIAFIPKNIVISDKEARIFPESQENIQVLESKAMENSEEKNVPYVFKPKFKAYQIFSYIWFFGVCVYLVFIFASYFFYIIKKRKNSVLITDCVLIDDIKKELKIKRNIKIRMANDWESPMLVGILFPSIYIPNKEISSESMRMIFRHELTHYKRKDLIFKWISLFVNTIHWFNPMSYILCLNLSEACELSCDMDAIKNMTSDEQQIYMKTILDLVE